MYLTSVLIKSSEGRRILAANPDIMPQESKKIAVRNVGNAEAFLNTSTELVSKYSDTAPETVNLLLDSVPRIDMALSEINRRIRKLKQ